MPYLLVDYLHLCMMQQPLTSEEREWQKRLKQAVLSQNVEKVHEVFDLKTPHWKTILGKDRYFINFLLRSALEHDNDKLLQILLDKSIGKSLLYATAEGSLKSVQIIVKKIEQLERENPGQTSYIGPNDYANERGYKTPLMIALEMNNYDIIEYFIKKGYDKINLFTDDSSESKKPAQDELGKRIGHRSSHRNKSCCNCVNPIKLTQDKFESLVREKTDDAEEKLVHLRIEAYRACANPLYISYKFLHKANDDGAISNPLYYVLDLHQKLRKQAWIDDEFKEDYEALSDRCEDFVEELMNQCRSITEKKILTNVLPDIERENMEKYIVVQSDKNSAKDLTFLNLAIKANCDKLIAHPFNQLRLNSVIYPDMATWRKRSFWRICTFTLRHLLLLPFLALISIFLTRKNGIIKYLENPMVKFISHLWSMLFFIALLIASSFQDKLQDELVKMSISEWMILVCLVGFIAHALTELSLQGVQRYFAQWWNGVMAVMLVVFSTSYVLRLIVYGITFHWAGLEPITDSSPSAWYKLILLANSLFSIGMVLSFIRLSVVFQVNGVLGPLQLSLYHLILDVIKFLMFFSLIFVGFGISLRKLYSHYISTQKQIVKAQETSVNGTRAETDHTFSSVGTGIYRLFWSIFGYTDLQTFKTKDKNFTITRETGEFLFGLFQVLAVIVAINMLIAMMTRSFEEIADNATKKWKVSRTRLWMFWVEKGNILPPPFNLLRLFRSLLVYLLKKIKNKPKASSNDIRNTDPERASTSAGRNSDSFDEIKFQREKEKINVILQRYIKISKDKVGMPKTASTEQLCHEKDNCL